jgi:hypothetical protein
MAEKTRAHRSFMRRVTFSKPSTELLTNCDSYEWRQREHKRTLLIDRRFLLRRVSVACRKTSEREIVGALAWLLSFGSTTQPSQPHALAADILDP